MFSHIISIVGSNADMNTEKNVDIWVPCKDFQIDFYRRHLVFCKRSDWKEFLLKLDPNRELWETETIEEFEKNFENSKK